MGIATIRAEKPMQLRIDPDAIQFTCSLNTSNENTYGGRVVQILSTTVSELTLPCQAGSGGRAYLAEMSKFFKDMMIWQRDSQNIAIFTYAPRNYTLHVYASSLSISDVTENVTFPFTLKFKVSEDAGGFVSSDIMKKEIDKLIDGIGYVKSVYNDPTKNQPPAATGYDPLGGLQDTTGGAAAGGAAAPGAAAGAAGGGPMGPPPAGARIMYDGTGPRLDTDGTQAPPFNDPNRQGQTSLPGLNAITTPFVVVNSSSELRKKFLIRNLTTNRQVEAIGGDIGHGFGEISYAAAQALGMNITGNAMPAHHIIIYAL